jgi:hypothetical protein
MERLLSPAPAYTAEVPTGIESRSWQRRMCSSPALLAATYSLLLFVAGLFLHPILGWTAELDYYVGMARQLTEGHVPRDVLHPLGYPVLVAAASYLTGEYFLAGRLVTAIAAGVLLWSAHRLGSNAFGSRGGWAAMLLVAVHPNVVSEGMQASSDMSAAATTAFALVLAVRVLGSGRRLDAFWAGLAFSLAYWIRYPALALVVAILPALLLPRARVPGERLRRLLAFALGAVIGLIPHCTLTYLRYGELFHDENWRNLALRHFGKVDGTLDFNFLWEMGFDSWWSVIRHAPMTVLEQSAAHLRLVYTNHLPQFLTGAERAAPGVVEWVVYAAIPVGWAVALRRGRPGLALAGLFSFCYLTATGITFEVWNRTAFLTFAPLLAAAVSIVWIAGALLGRWPRLALALQLAILFGLAGDFASRIPNTLGWLAGREPHAEYAAIAELIRQHGPRPIVGTTMGQLEIHLDFEPRWLPVEYARRPDPVDYMRQLAGAAARDRPQFLVLGSVTCGDRFRLQQMSELMPRPGFSWLRRDPDVIVWRVHDPVPLAEWQPVPRITPNPYTGGRVRIEVELPVEAGVTGVRLQAVDPGGRTHGGIELQLGPDRASLELAADGLERGTWQLRAEAQRDDGRIVGPPVDLIVQ